MPDKTETLEGRFEASPSSRMRFLGEDRRELCVGDFCVEDFGEEKHFTLTEGTDRRGIVGEGPRMEVWVWTRRSWSADESRGR